ncbi:HEPN domain-containing protein [Hydrogenispora ethanolica]|uniref:HEPN domain-containing protein n=1 Tax=Hydrogenispora ethanolica TaxID=1082276 RepID=A0A4R1S8C3_HYDET|nr:HEPN domain-containing protein [Hydrogenispora ethanolica]TCL75140.1 HEPN domain-containing protein [Hydrogenispora ethanolica]
MVDSIDPGKWFGRSLQDLRTIANNLKDDPEFLAPVNCYLAQQAVEKLLKTYLLAKKGELLKTHDLMFLLKKCTEIHEEFINLQSTVEILNAYAIEARYPGDFFDNISAAQAQEAYEAALSIKEFVNQLL